MPRPAGGGRKSKAKHAGGRPTLYTKKLAETICGHIADGRGLKSICQAEDMPGETTVYRWLRMEDHAEFRHMYARAREDQQDHWADEIIEIADDATNDWMERRTKSGGTVAVVNSDNINRSRLRVDTRKWLMAKLMPRKYGDFKTLEHRGQMEFHVKRITLVDHRKTNITLKKRTVDPAP